MIEVAPVLTIFIEAILCWSLQWRDNGRDGVSNHQPHDYSLHRLFRRRSKKTLKFRVTGICEGDPVDFSHKGPVTRKMFPFDDVIMLCIIRDEQGSPESEYSKPV